MNGKRIALIIVFLAFLDVTALAVYHHGYLGFFELGLANAATRALSADLVIALSLVSWWMWHDARARGASFAPYFLVTLAFGSAGPLLYLIVRERRTQPIPRAAEVPC